MVVIVVDKIRFAPAISNCDVRPAVPELFTVATRPLMHHYHRFRVPLGMLRIYPAIKADLAVLGPKERLLSGLKAASGRRQEHWRPLTRNPRQSTQKRLSRQLRRPLPGFV